MMTFLRGFGSWVGVLALVACGDDGGSASDAAVDTGSQMGCTRDAQCDDGVYCNGAETCEAGDCVAGSAVVCDDGDACTTDRCDEVTEACVAPLRDLDHDGHADATCLGGDDCDDDNADRFPGNPERCDAVDQDCDARTFGSKDTDGDGAIDDTCCNTDDSGALLCGTDCDDNDRARHPRQPEFCDLKDNDCDDVTDDNTAPVAWYLDADGDGFGSTADVTPVLSCDAVTGRSILNTDCDDSDGARHPGQTELCDGIDNNCNGVIDERVADCATAPPVTDPLPINECFNALHNCHGRADCADALSGFDCTCRPGFMGDGVTCEDISDCGVNNGGCDARADCDEGIGVPSTCVCPWGYTTHDNGMTCIDCNEASVECGCGPCGQDATCTFVPNGYVCECKVGFIGDGTTCVPDNG